MEWRCGTLSPSLPPSNRLFTFTPTSFISVPAGESRRSRTAKRRRVPVGRKAHTRIQIFSPKISEIAIFIWLTTFTQRQSTSSLANGKRLRERLREHLCGAQPGPKPSCLPCVRTCRAMDAGPSLWSLLPPLADFSCKAYSCSAWQIDALRNEVQNLKKIVEQQTKEVANPDLLLRLLLRHLGLIRSLRVPALLCLSVTAARGSKGFQ